MKLIGQRWEFRVGNSVIHADNAFTYTLWAQERFVFNGEILAQTSGRMRYYANTRQPWLTSTGDGEVRITLRSALKGITCRAFLDDEPLEPDRIVVARWNGPKLSWPHEENWRDDVPLDYVAK